MLDLVLNIITCILLLVIIDAVFMLYVFYRSFIVAVEEFLNCDLDLDYKSKISILITVSDVYKEILFEDWVETLLYMPINAVIQPNLGAEIFSQPFYSMMRDGLIAFDSLVIEDRKKEDD